MRIDTAGDGPILVWLRRDLRLTDNPALDAAVSTGRSVIPLYILDETEGVRPMGAASLWWLDKSLAALGADIEQRGGRLILRRGKAAEILNQLVAETGAAGVVWNRLYDKASIDRDAAIKADLRGQGLTCESFNASLLNEPWTVKNGSGEGYKVFTPYWRAAREHIGEVHVSPAPAA
ncbi:MAG TPA: deoxyribodipyrimidine photo-lyase, partial [Caulobacter sp.]|nr:deoxyribodipyrimidine photo-lyase [Caulobacter sp.]